MPIDFIRQGLGLDLESQAENYRDRLTDTRSGIKRWALEICLQICLQKVLVKKLRKELEN